MFPQAEHLNIELKKLAAPNNLEHAILSNFHCDIYPLLHMSEIKYSFAEEMDVDRKSCIRVRNPPGGKSSGFW